MLKIEQDASKRIYPTANYTNEDWRQYRHAYYKLVEKVDAEIGKILNAIDDLNLRENTLILFTEIILLWKLNLKGKLHLVQAGEP